MNKHIFFDDILHAFESNGNLHFVLGVISGNVDETGNNIGEAIATLVIPNTRANSISENLVKAVTVLLPLTPLAPKETMCQTEGGNEKVEYLGQGVRFAG